MKNNFKKILPKNADMKLHGYEYILYVVMVIILIFLILIF